LKVSPELLQRNGVKTLQISSKSASIFITDQELHAAIIQAVQEKINRTLPASVWS
jgi:hypothetical protein